MAENEAWGTVMVLVAKARSTGDQDPDPFTEDAREFASATDDPIILCDETNVVDAVITYSHQRQVERQQREQLEMLLRQLQEKRERVEMLERQLRDRRLQEEKDRLFAEVTGFLR